jgi:hypothetical protein
VRATPLSNGFRLSGLDHTLYDNDGYARQLSPEFRGLAPFFTLAVE